MIKKYSILLLLATTWSSMAQETTVTDSIPAKENQLDEVHVEKKKPTYTTKNGVIKVDIANSIYNSIPNPLDVLRKLPNVIVSADGEGITIMGRGAPLIYLDNQKIGMNELNALVTDDIKSIEIISNPSSKYEADGRAVVLITRKIGSREGFRSTLSENASFKRFYSNYLNLNSSVQKGRFEVKANLSYNQSKPWEGNASNFTIAEKDLQSGYEVRAKTFKPELNSGVGVVYKINDTDYFSFTANNQYIEDHSTIYAKSTLIQESNATRVATDSDTRAYRNFLNTFLNYQKKFKEKEAQLFTGFQYSGLNRKGNYDVYNTYNDAAPLYSQFRKQHFILDAFSGRIDYEQLIGKGIKWEIGVLYGSTTARSVFSVDDYEQEATTYSNYRHQEQQSAVYTQLSGIFHKMSYRLGARMEDMKIRGHFKDDSAAPIRKQLDNFFPKVQLDFPVDSTQTISLNYARSIERPEYASLTQVTAYINPYYAFSQNINLNPAFTSEVALNYQRDDKSVKLTYYDRRGSVYYGYDYDAAKTLLTSLPINFKKETGYTLEFTLPFTHNSWNSINIVSVLWNRVEDPSVAPRNSNPFLYLYSSQMFTLPRDFTIAVSGWGIGKRTETFFNTQPIWCMDLSVSKKLGKSWQCTVSCNDIWKSMAYKQDMHLYPVAIQTTYFTNVHEFALNLRYTFGKVKASGYTEKVVNENANRIR